MPVDFNQELRLSYLRAAMNAQDEVEAKIQIYRDFWEGEQGIDLTDRQEEYIINSPESWGNICERVVNIPKDRLAIESDGITPADAESVAYSDQASEWWRLDGLDAKQKDLYEAGLRDGSVALIVDWNEAEDRPTFVPNLIKSAEEGLVRFHYDSDNNLLFASKQWVIVDTLDPGTSGDVRLTTYRPGLIDRFISDNSVAGGWRPLTPEELGGLPNPQFWTDTGTQAGQPLGIPVVPFDNPGDSELKNIIVLQELLNHNLGTIDISIDFHGFPLLWLSGINLPVSSSTGKSILPTFGPGQGILLDNDGSMGKIESADIKAMWDGGVLTWVQLIALIKGWPLHLFDRSQTPPSGVALQIMEGSLVKQVQDKQVVFGAAWGRAFDQARKINKLRGGEDLPGTLKFNWVDPATHDPLLKAQAMAARFEALQLPLISRWREAGFTDDQVEQMIQDAQREDEFGLVDLVTNVEQ